MLVGTAGWHDHTGLYPRGTSPAGKPACDATRFPVVEGNATACAVPVPVTVTATPAVHVSFNTWGGRQGPCKAGRLLALLGQPDRASAAPPARQVGLDLFPGWRTEA